MTEHVHEYATDRQLHSEARAWVNLITIELRKRRDEKRAKAGG